MALNNKKKITESEDIVEHSADLVFEIYTSDIAKHVVILEVSMLWLKRFLTLVFRLLAKEILMEPK